METFKDAATLLGLSYSAIARRVSLLGMETGRDEEGRMTVDVPELSARWEARRGEVRPRKNGEAFLSVTIREDQRFAIEQFAAQRKTSLANTVRWLLDEAFTSENFKHASLD